MKKPPSSTVDPFAPSHQAPPPSAAGDPSMDLFSSTAQHQLQEFDLIRNEIEGGANNGNSNGNNGAAAFNNGGEIFRFLSLPFFNTCFDDLAHVSTFQERNLPTLST